MSWSRIESKGEVPEARHSASVVCRGGQLVVFGGTSAKEAFNNTYILDAATATWSQAQCSGQIPPARWGHRAHLWGADTMVVFGGADVDHGALLDIRLLDLRSLEWTRPASVSGATPPARSYHGTALLGDTLYVLGGDTAAKTDATLYTLDFRSFAWDAVQRGSVPAPPAKKLTLTASPDGTRLAVFGGVALSNLQYQEDLRVFDVASKTWSTGGRGAVPGPRAGHIAVNADGVNKMVVFGGQAGRNAWPTETHEMSWETTGWFKRRGTGAVPSPRALACACEMPDKQRVFVCGGLSAADERTPLADAFVYNPAAAAF